jgi:hypothetical protein
MYRNKEEKLKASMDWLEENYGHIWYDTKLPTAAKAGFLAAVCHPHRCYLMTLSLHDRYEAIFRTLVLRIDP